MLLSWIDYAICSSHPDPDIWFESRGRTADKAKSICAKCPVMLECRSYGLVVRLDNSPETLYGVWGGLTKSERRRKTVAKERLDEALEILWRKKHSRPSMMS